MCEWNLNRILLFSTEFPLSFFGRLSWNVPEQSWLVIFWMTRKWSYSIHLALEGDEVEKHLDGISEWNMVAKLMSV